MRTDFHSPSAKVVIIPAKQSTTKLAALNGATVAAVLVPRIEADLAELNITSAAEAGRVLHVDLVLVEESVLIVELEL